MATAMGGTMLLTDQLLPILRKSTKPRIINISSGGAYTVRARLMDLNTETMSKYDGTLIYVRQITAVLHYIKLDHQHDFCFLITKAFAKRNQIELSECWAERLGSSVFVGCMHPGWADTEGLQEAMPDFHTSNKDTLRSASHGADTITFLASCPKDLDSGKFWFDRQVWFYFLSLNCV